MTDLSTPYLVQRGTTIDEVSDLKKKKFSDVVSLDYMGSAEFEFGALPRSLRALGSEPTDLDPAELKVRVVTQITENGDPLYVVSKLTDVQFEQYREYLLRMRNESTGRLRLKESSRFDPSRDAFGINFWWDVENHVMWSFKKMRMKAMPANIKNSITFMNEQKAKAA